jgi:hypothetical protein
MINDKFRQTCFKSKKINTGFIPEFMKSKKLFTVDLSKMQAKLEDVLLGCDRGNFGWVNRYRNWLGQKRAE